MRARLGKYVCATATSPPPPPPVACAVTCAGNRTENATKECHGGWGSHRQKKSGKWFILLSAMFRKRSGSASQYAHIFLVSRIRDFYRPLFLFDAESDGGDATSVWKYTDTYEATGPFKGLSETRNLVPVSREKNGAALAQWTNDRLTDFSFPELLPRQQLRLRFDKLRDRYLSFRAASFRPICEKHVDNARRPIITSFRRSKICFAHTCLHIVYKYSYMFFRGH